MRFNLLPAVLLLSALGPACCLAADSHEVTFDASVDFEALQTFTISSGHIASDKPEIDNRLFRQRMEYAVREALLKKGLEETTGSADITVKFHYDDRDVSGVERTGPTRIPDSPGARGFVIPGSGPSPVMFTEGTLVIDLHDAAGILLWRGTWRDEEKSGPRLSAKLSDDARKLLREFPPRRRQGLFAD